MSAQTENSWFDPESTTFGDRVAGARERADMNQAELARRLGVKLKTLKAWEEDLSEPRANRVSMLAGLLNVSLFWLLTGEGQGPEGPDAQTEEGEFINAILSEMNALSAQLATTTKRLTLLEQKLREKQRNAVDA